MSSRPCTAPGALRRPGITCDNIALAPASLLPYKARYQAIANGLPRGDILIVLPTTDTPQKRTLEHAAQLFEAKGKRVTTIPAGQVERSGQLSLLPAE